MNDAPIGFLMALSQDEQAMSRYSNLSKAERQQLLEKAKKADSRREMQSLVDSIGQASQ